MKTLTRTIPQWKKLAVPMGRFLFVFLLSASQTTDGYTPWALALVCAAGPGLPGLTCLAGAAVGAWAFLDFQPGLRYLATAILIFAANTAFLDTRFYGTKRYRGILAASTMLLVQSVYLLHRDAAQWAQCIAATCLCAFAAATFDSLQEKPLDSVPFHRLHDGFRAAHGCSKLFARTSFGCRVGSSACRSAIAGTGSRQRYVHRLFHGSCHGYRAVIYRRLWYCRRLGRTAAGAFTVSAYRCFLSECHAAVRLGTGLRANRSGVRGHYGRCDCPDGSRQTLGAEACYRSTQAGAYVPASDGTQRCRIPRSIRQFLPWDGSCSAGKSIRHLRPRGRAGLSQLCAVR